MHISRMLPTCARVLGSTCLLLMLCIGSFAQSAVESPLAHARCSGNLPELLRFVAQRYQLPIIAELSYPVPSLSIAEGTNTAKQVLADLTKAAPDYTFDVLSGPVVHFYNKKIVKAPGNFLNVHLRRFTMPSNMSDFKVLFRARLGAARRGLQGEGVVTSGFGEPDLEKETLPQIELMNASGREILLKAAEATHGFYTIIVFPNRFLKSKASVDYAFQHWFWGSVKGKDSTPMYIQKAPSEQK